jgi:hypothetical protein
MAYEGRYLDTTIEAGADYSGSGKQYHAIALADGELAANGGEASGILLSKPADTHFAQMGYLGEMKFAAGLAITKDDPLTVTTSGWFTAAASGDYIVGRAKAAVTSGSVGTGFFQFLTPVYGFSSSFAW